MNDTELPKGAEPSVVRAVLNQRRAVVLALVLAVGAFWVTVPMGNWQMGTLAAAGVTLLGAALPNAGFAASLERCAVAGPAPAFDCVALPVALAVLDAGFLALVAIGFPHYTHAVSAITGGNY